MGLKSGCLDAKGSAHENPLFTCLSLQTCSYFFSHVERDVGKEREDVGPSELV